MTKFRSKEGNLENTIKPSLIPPLMPYSLLIKHRHLWHVVCNELLVAIFALLGFKILGKYILLCDTLVYLQ